MVHMSIALCSYYGVSGFGIQPAGSSEKMKEWVVARGVCASYMLRACACVSATQVPLRNDPCCVRYILLLKGGTYIWIGNLKGFLPTRQAVVQFYGTYYYGGFSSRCKGTYRNPLRKHRRESTFIRGLRTEAQHLQVSYGHDIVTSYHEPTLLTPGSPARDNSDVVIRGH